MSLWQWALVALAAVAVCGAGLTAAIAVTKRRACRLAEQAREIRILCDRLIDDPRSMPHQRLVLRALRAYLDLRWDMIPDFIPLIGRVDDRLITALAMRIALRHASAELIRQHWPGPGSAPRSVLRRAKGRARRAVPTTSAPA